MKRRLRFFSIVAVLALVVAACSSDSDTTTTTETPAETTTTAATEETASNTIADVVVGNEDFSTLLAAVEAAGLTDALADADATLTVFAPTNDAFEAALEALDLTAEELLADTETLTSILNYHVLGEIVTSGDIAAAGTEEIPVETLGGAELIVVVGDAGNVGFRDQEATVTQADVEADNGVIHVIDAVLLPPAS
jgi:uncharacterized surface protein with fasciclin (FAS1) repeats